MGILKVLKNKFNQKEFLYFIIFFTSDIISLSFAFYFSFILRFYITKGEITPDLFIYYYIYSVIGIIVSLFIFYSRKLYAYNSIYRNKDENAKIALGVFISVFIIMALNNYINRDTYQLSRIWLIYITVFPIIFSIALKYILRLFLSFVWKKRNIVINTLVIGLNEESNRIAKTLSKNKVEKVNIVGFLIDNNQSSLNNLDYNVLGNLSNIINISKKYQINRIIISSKNLNYFEILDLIDKVKDLNIDIQLSPSLFEFSVKRMSMFEVMGIPFIGIESAEIKGMDRFYKSLFDYVFGLFIFLVFLIVYPIIGIFIKLESKGPVLFTQHRYGKEFRKIKIFKFRTMRCGAENEKKYLEELLDRSSGFKIKDDPRITKIGKFLRKTSIDELPQIINVLRGELSIVGPRALVIQEGDQLKKWERKRMKVKQGITGLWQVSGRNDLSYEERIKLDLYYVNNWSIYLEIKIIFKTIIKIFGGKGAY